MQRTTTAPRTLEAYFAPFRGQVVGYDQTFDTPYGAQRLLYADWTASGRLYHPIEQRLHHQFGPFVGNTHTETTVTGTAMTYAYHHAKDLIKRHVHAGPADVLIMAGSGMTGAVSKFQRILGLKAPEQIQAQVRLPDSERPVVFVTHMEHHSNHTSWLETLADVECILPDSQGLIDYDYLLQLLERYSDRRLRIASVTACSNVSGIQTDYHKIARIMHAHGGLCFVDFACSAPYVPIDMHPADPLARLDAIYFSPHKFLGGPGSPGVLLFDSALYHNRVPDQPGGGTVAWTNPWGEHQYISDIESREDGGTPAFLQTIRAALAIGLKEEMGVQPMLEREHELLQRLFAGLRHIPGLHILAGEIEDRLGVISFYIDGLHFNLGVKLLNDRFGIQMRGGCSCAGTYGHLLLNIPRDVSRQITSEIDAGCLASKPGWIRLSIHPVMTDAEIDYLLEAIDAVARHHRTWGQDYRYDDRSNEFQHRAAAQTVQELVYSWFSGL
ncbi:MAG: aminotransferase class V-fold PLP-dependent enzyme [Bacteroidia bacterium]